MSEEQQKPEQTQVSATQIEAMVIQTLAQYRLGLTQRLQSGISQRNEIFTKIEKLKDTDRNERRVLSKGLINQVKEVDRESDATVHSLLEATQAQGNSMQMHQRFEQIIQQEQVKAMQQAAIAAAEKEKLEKLEAEKAAAAGEGPLAQVHSILKDAQPV